MIWNKMCHFQTENPYYVYYAILLYQLSQQKLASYNQKKDVSPLFADINSNNLYNRVFIVS